MQILSLAESVVSEDLDVTEHGFDDLLCPGKFSLNLLTIVLGVFRMEMVDSLGLVLYPSLDVIQLAVSYLRFLVNLFCKSLKLFQAFVKNSAFKCSFVAEKQKLLVSLAANH